MRAPVARHARERVVQEVELLDPADERRRDADLTRLLLGADHAARPDRPVDSPQVDRPEIFGLDAVEREPVCARADQDLVGRGLLLEPHRHVDRLAGREGQVGFVRDDLARLDPDAGLELELAHALEDGEPGLHSAQGIVLVRLGDAEGDHDGVAGIPPHRAPMRLDAILDVLEEALHAPARDLGIGSGDERGRVDEVDEHDRCELSLHPSSLRTRQVAPCFRYRRGFRRPRARTTSTFVYSGARIATERPLRSISPAMRPEGVK